MKFLWFGMGPQEERAEASLCALRTIERTLLSTDLGNWIRHKELLAAIQKPLSEDDEAVLAHLLRRFESLEKRMSALAHRTQ